MINTTNQAFAEISDILNHLDIELYKKIPNSFVNMINLHKDKDYKISIDYSRNINSQVLHETKIILGLMYRDYFISEEERKKLKIQEKEEKLEEEKLREIYNPDTLFKRKSKIETIEKNTECKELVEYKKECFLTIILRKIKSLFRK